jgi:nucleotide-binding universal stress UspA family protein
VRVLLAIDDSIFSEAATQAVIQQIRPDHVEVSILHVVKPLLLNYAYIDEAGELGAAEEEVERGRELVGRVEQQMTKAGLKVRALVEKGDPRAVIVDHSLRWKADLIVLGSHGLKGLDRLLLGSTSEAVLRHAHCSVEIVRIPQAR